MEWLKTELDSLADTHRLRVPTVTRWITPVRVIVEGDALCAFCGNDYLGLRFHPDLRAAALAALPEHGTGSGASRMVSGNLCLHESAEDSLARFVGADAALLGSSGYALNLATLAALLGPDDLVLSDALNHASLIDGMRLSRARVTVFPHLELDAVREGLRAPARRRWVVTESLFSMDGDTPDLAALRAIADEAGAQLYVDEAHALGVYGPQGRGLCAERGVGVEVLVGTLGKSLGGSGAFIAGSDTLRRWLWNRCRAHVFSTGVAPVNAAVARCAVALLTRDPSPIGRLRENARSLRADLQGRGITVLGEPDSPILPVVIGDDARAMALARACREGGYFVQAIRPPTVPEGSARLRVTVSAAHRPEELRGFADRLEAALRR